MRRCLNWAIRLYPAAWRTRYAREFDAMLDDLPTRWSDLWDIVRGAILMQLSTPAVYLKLGVVTAMLGALIAGGVSFTLPERFVSSAVMRITPPAAERLTALQARVLSRMSLAEMVQRPNLDLYRQDRMRYPMEDVLMEMRRRDIRIQAVDDSSFRISYEYGDRKTAQAVVRALVTAFTEANVTTQSSGFGASNLEVLDRASLPDKAVRPNRLAIIGIGLVAGFALGLLLAFLRGQPLRWSLWMVASGAAGFAAALAVALAREFDPAPFACLGLAAAISLAAFLMRDRAAWRPAPYLKSALAAGALTAIAAGFASFAIPEQYVSTATLRAAGIPGTAGAARERLHQMQQEILSRSSLAEIIQRPSLDLYRRQRQRYPLEDIILDMRRNIEIRPMNSALSAFSISFEYPNRFKAQAVVRELITKFVEMNVSTELALGHERDTPGAIRLEVLDPASDPQLPVSPNRLQIAAIAFAAGLVLGLLIAFLYRRPPGQARAMLRFAAAGGTLGALIAGAATLAIPSRYVSTAVLRVRSEAQSGDRVQQLMMQILSRQNMDDEMRRHVHIQSLDVGLRGKTTAFSISCEANDPGKAHTMAQTLVSRFVESNLTYNPPGTDPANLEVLDPATTPDAPSSPERAPIVAGGVLAGFLLGPVAQSRLRVRRQSEPRP